MRRASLAAAVAALVISLTGCGGSAPVATTPAAVSNTQQIVVDLGPSLNGQTVGADNSLYTNVQICLPGSATTCQTIDHILVDTGSSGLRLLSTSVGLNLPYITDASNNTIGNCIQFPDTSFQWGPMAKVDVHLAAEVATVPIQIVSPTNFVGPPAACSAGGVAANTISSLGAKGILGVGLFRQDCGAPCASSSPPNVYFSCPASGCTPTTVALTSQLQNPVWMFSSDNNGLSITLPAIGPTGATTVVGTISFGIGTQTDNALPANPLVQAATAKGTFTTTFGGVAYTNSYIDSGVGAYYFLDSATTGLPNCGNGDAAGFYCPASPVSLTAITSGPNPSSSGTIVSQSIAFSVWNALTLIDSGNPAFNNIGGPNPGAFVWGLPFFYGRTVFIGIEGQTTPAGTGPYWSY